MLKLLSFSGCGRDKNGESVFERYRSLAGHMTRHPRTFITTAPSSAQATRRRSSSRDPSSTPAICTSPASSARYISSARRATSNSSLPHMMCPALTRCARRSSPASRAAHFSRSSSSWRSAGARLCSAASSPRCHRLRRTEGHYACTAHERSLYAPVFAAASPASTQLPRTLIPQVASGCSGTNIYTAEPA